MYEYTSRNEFFKYLSSLPQRQNERAILDTRLLRLTIPTNIAKLVQIHKKKRPISFVNSFANNTECLIMTVVWLCPLYIDSKFKCSEILIKLYF